MFSSACLDCLKLPVLFQNETRVDYYSSLPSAKTPKKQKPIDNCVFYGFGVPEKSRGAETRPGGKKRFAKR